MFFSVVPPLLRCLAVASAKLSWLRRSGIRSRASYLETLCRETGEECTRSSELHMNSTVDGTNRPGIVADEQVDLSYQDRQSKRLETQLGV